MAPLKPAHTTCVLYDAADGSILLTHTVVHFGGARAAGRKSAESEAREILSSRKHQSPGLKALHVDADALEPGAAYRVTRGKMTRRDRAGRK